MVDVFADLVAVCACICVFLLVTFEEAHCRHLTSFAKCCHDAKCVARFSVLNSRVRFLHVNTCSLRRNSVVLRYAEGILSQIGSGKARTAGFERPAPGEIKRWLPLAVLLQRVVVRGNSSPGRSHSLSDYRATDTVVTARRNHWD